MLCWACAFLCAVVSVWLRAVTLGTVPEVMARKASIKYFVSVLSFVCLQTSDFRSAAVMLASAALSDHTCTFLIPKCTREILFSVIPPQTTTLCCFFPKRADKILISLLFSFVFIFFYLFQNKLERDLICIKEAGLCFQKPYFSLFFCFLEQVQQQGAHMQSHAAEVAG